MIGALLVTLPCCLYAIKRDWSWPWAIAGLVGGSAMNVLLMVYT